MDGRWRNPQGKHTNVNLGGTRHVQGTSPSETMATVRNCSKDIVVVASWNGVDQKQTTGRFRQLIGGMSFARRSTHADL